MRTVDNLVCATYREACQKFGLLTDAAECKRALRDGFESSFQPLTELFALIVSQCQLADPKVLFFEHKDIFIADLRNRYRNHPELRDEELSLQYIYAEIQQCLQASGYSTNEQFGIPSADPNLPLLRVLTREDGPTELRRNAEEAISKFNDEQHQVINEIIESVLPEVSSTDLDVEPGSQRENMQRLLLVDALGNTGKTFVTSAVQRYIKSKGLKVLTLASSSVAAQLLDGGRTAHSALKIPIPVHHQSACSIDVSSALADELSNTSFFIWDEIVMTHRHDLEAFDRTFRDLMRSTLPFGGKFSGVSQILDKFCQL